MEESRLRELLEASLTELIEILALRQPEPGTMVRVRSYAEALLCYMQCDFEGLRRIEAKLNEGTDELLKALIRVRIEVREVAVQTSSLERLKATLATEAVEWHGEIEFVLGTGYLVRDEYVEASALYLSASRKFDSMGCPQKAISALINWLVAETCIDPDKKRIAEYNFIYRRARKVGAKADASCALLNVSREYQKVGAIKTALRYCDRALVLLKDDCGGMNYYLTLVHRCDLLVSAGRMAEAQRDFEEASLADFPEVRSALQVIAAKLGVISADDAASAKLNPTWKERLDELKAGASSQPLGTLEDRLIACLGTGPKDKYELIEHLYGIRIDIESADMRLKRLFGRIRKKHPGLIVFWNGRYRLSEEVKPDEVAERLQSG